MTKKVVTKKYLLDRVPLSSSDFNNILVTLLDFLSQHHYMYFQQYHTHTHSCSFAARLPPHFSYLSQTWSLRPLWNSDSVILLCCWFILSDRLTFGGAHVIAPWMSEYFEKSLPNSVPKLVNGKRPGSVEPLFSRSWSPRVPPTPLTICLRPVVPIFVTAALDCNVKKDLFRRPNEA